MLVLACGVAAGTGVLIAGALSGGNTTAHTTAGARQTMSEPAPITGTPAAGFRYLANQNSNRCGLTPIRLQSYPLTQRLQGSCCDPMDLSTYEWQVKALRAYAAIPQIPRNPYDVPVSLARQLLGYGNSIRLSAPQQATYDKAMQMSREHGPCCCHCWRWSAFRGMSQFLITHGWTAPRVALIIDDVEGCGGRGEPPRIPSRATA
jgi:hypothetical protein